MCVRHLRHKMHSFQCAVYSVLLMSVQCNSFNNQIQKCSQRLSNLVHLAVDGRQHLLAQHGLLAANELVPSLTIAIDDE